jgi:radical SAM protein with 4Fe4S-binding SPASM domain
MSIATAPRSTPAGEAFVPQFPFHLVWNITNACNLRCEHCFSASGKPLPGELTTAEAIDLLDQLAEVGVFDLAFCGGEPLIRRDVFDLLAHAADRGITTGIGSNGWLVNERLLARLRNVGVQRIQVSLDGLAGNHDRIRRRTGLFARTVGAIGAGVASGLRTHVCFTAHQGNLADLEPVIDLCAKLGVHLFNLSQFVPVGRGERVRDLSIQQWRDVLELWGRKRQQYAGRMAFTSHLAQLALIDPEFASCYGFRGCQAGTGQGAITATGDVLPCIVLPISVGNIRERPFADIWADSPILRQLRARDHLGGLCGSCTLRERCGGCRAVAWAYSGDCLAEDPRCWLVDAARNHTERRDRG